MFYHFMLILLNKMITAAIGVILQVSVKDISGQILEAGFDWWAVLNDLAHGKGP